MYLAIFGKCIHTEGFVLLINQGNCLIRIVYSQNRKNRATDFLLHDGIGFCDFCQNRWGFGQKTTTALNLM